MLSTSNSLQRKPTPSVRRQRNSHDDARAIRRADADAMRGDVRALLSSVEELLAVIAAGRGEDVRPGAFLSPLCYDTHRWAEHLRAMAGQETEDLRAQVHDERAAADRADARRFVARQAKRPDLETVEHKAAVARLLAYTRAEAARLRQVAGARA